MHDEDEIRIKCLEMARQDMDHPIRTPRDLENILNKARLYWAFIHGEEAVSRVYSHIYGDKKLTNRVSEIVLKTK